jgi:uncharacterized protein
VKTHDCTHVPAAHSFRERLAGLIGRRDPARLSLLIPRCSAVHTWFMRASIDIVFLDDRSMVLTIAARVRPWRVLRGPRGTRSVLELPPGGAEQFAPGDLVRL